MDVSITGSTRVAAVIGNPIEHSLSPRIHNAGFKDLGLDWVYTAFSVSSGEAQRAIDAMRLFNLGGFSVTTPLKHEISQVVDRLTESAAALDSCNCVYWGEEGELVGDSTDGNGFVRDFERSSTERVSGKDVLVLGSGGAAKSIIQALGVAGAQSIVVVNRSEEAAHRAADLAACARVGTVEEVEDVSLVVNATTFGMKGTASEGSSLVPSNLWSSSHTVVDIIYTPLQTKMMADAAKVGASVHGGVGMLVCQAAYAFERWTKNPAPLDAMYVAADTIIN